MDYEKRYKELAGKMKKAYLYAQTDSTKAVLEDIMPELKESEDDRILEIIKHCIESRYLHTSTIKGISQKECFAWLEKQGEQKDFAPKDEPKFKVGEKELTNEELCEGLIRGMVNEHNRVVKEVLRAEYEKGRADAIAEMQKEWSDVDKDILFCIINDLKFLRDTISIDPKYAVNIIDMEREITWLKSLRPQNQWKPSDEQMELLSEVQSALLGKDCHNRFTDFMWELKKLKEE